MSGGSEDGGPEQSSKCHKSFELLFISQSIILIIIGKHLYACITSRAKKKGGDILFFRYPHASYFLKEYITN